MCCVRFAVRMWHKTVQEQKHSKQCKEIAKQFRDRKLLCKVCSQSTIGLKTISSDKPTHGPLKPCYPHMPIGMLGIYHLLLSVCLFFLSAGFLVTDISGVG